MHSIPAAQLIFTNVETEQSPTGRRGFQVLFYTQSQLTESESLDIERRLFYSPQEEQIKWVFFPLGSEKIILARIAPLMELDRFGRKGRSFAHALVFKRQDFSSLDNNPFPIFHNFGFLCTVQEALDAGDFRTGHIPPVSIAPLNIDLHKHKFIPLPFEALQSFSLLATQATTQSTKDEQAQSKRYQSDPVENSSHSIGCYGSSLAVFQTIETLFETLPSPIRTACSFDTLFRDGTLSQLPYWAVGLQENSSRHDDLWHYDTVKQRFESPVTVTVDSTYGAWLSRSLPSLSSPSQGVALSQVASNPSQLSGHMNVREYTDRNSAAYWLGEWFDGRDVDWHQVSYPIDELFRSFSALRPKALEFRIRDSLLPHVGSLIAKRLAVSLRAQTQSQGAAAIEMIRRGFEAQLIRDLVQEFYTTPGQSYNTISSDEWYEVERFASQHRNYSLRLVCLRWTEQWLEMSEAIRDLKEEEFQSYARWALGTLTARVQWFVRAEANGIMFGPCAQGLESSEDVEDEVTGLLFSLLGIYSRSTYDPNHSSSASRTHQSSARPSRNALKQLFRRDEDTNSFFPLPPAKVQRWLWLMQCLYEQSVGRS